MRRFRRPVATLPSTTIQFRRGRSSTSSAWATFLLWISLSAETFIPGSPSRAPVRSGTTLSPCSSFRRPPGRQSTPCTRGNTPSPSPQDPLLFYHSCGFIEPIIPGLIDAGFQILNPVQPESMDPIRIKRLFGGRMSLWGGIGVQSTMLEGSADDVRTAVGTLMREWTRGGGGIVTAAQTILRDVPWENVLALVEAIRGRPAG